MKKSLIVLAASLILTGQPNVSLAESDADPNARQGRESGPEYQTYDAETFFMTTSYGGASSSGLAFSPDNRQVLVSSDQTGVFNAVAIDVSDSQQSQLTTSTTNAVFAQSFFPDDRRLLYTFDEGGNELNHVYVKELDDTRKDLTPGEKVKAAFGGWSGDKSRFYILTQERDGKSFDVYAYDAEDYEREMIFENTDGYSVEGISDDGRWVALVKNRTSADSDIYVVDLKGAEKSPHLISDHDGNIAYSVLTFTPDNKQLYYLTDEFGEFAQAWSHDLETGKKSLVHKDDWDVIYMSFSQTGKYRVTGVNADAEVKVSIMNTETGKPLKAPELPPGEILSVRFSNDDKRMAFFINGDTSPSNLYVMNLESSNLARLTNALNPAINPANLVEGEVVRYKSFDGLDIPAILYKPRQAARNNKVPALVWVHGGPGGQSTKGYSATIQHLVNHGYAILAANNRGSSGYGKTFFHLDDKKHGEEDLQDIVQGRKYLESLPWVDGDRVGIIGGSYGGYMVAAALAFEPEAFEVGIDIFGVTNWVRTLKSIPPWWESFKEALYDEMGDPAQDEERHKRISPLFHAKNIVKPMLVIQGANDPRVLQVESDELVAAARANDVHVEYVVFPDEGHGFRKRENRIKASESYVKFLDEYLKGEAPESEDPKRRM